MWLAWGNVRFGGGGKSGTKGRSKERESDASGALDLKEGPQPLSGLLAVKVRGSDAER